MALQDFPVLPETYPLFEWENWPKSYASLIPGGPTKQFEKACWNALVDTVADAVEAAGMQWWDGEHFPDDIKMLPEGNVRLPAAYFNHLRSAIDNILELPWRWDYDETSRGYIGRLNFYGSNGKIQDVVYPEYFLELANHINMVLRIMRGTAQTEMQTVRHNNNTITKFRSEQAPAATIFPRKVPARTIVTSGSSVILLGDLIDFPDHTSRTYTKGPQWQSGTVIYSDFREHTYFNLIGNVRPSDPLSMPVRLLSKESVELSFNKNEYMNVRKNTSTHNQAALSYLMLVAATMARSKNHSYIAVPMRSVPPKEMKSNGNAWTRSRISIDLNPPAFEKMEEISTLTIHNPEMDLWDYRKTQEFVPIIFSVPSLQEVSAVKSHVLNMRMNARQKTTFTLNAILKPPLETDTSVVSVVTANPGLTRHKTAVIKKFQYSGINTDVKMPAYRGAAVFTESDSKMKTTCTLDAFVWEYPEWRDGGLLIRQAYDIQQDESGELEII